jgi:hypothetical protein
MEMSVTGGMLCSIEAVSKLIVSRQDLRIGPVSRSLTMNPEEAGVAVLAPLRSKLRSKGQSQPTYGGQRLVCSAEQ